MIITCLIIDDEPIARDIVNRYAGFLPELQVVANASNALEARDLLQQYPIDLLFLDINMPELDGLSFLKTLKEPPLVILTTAYKEFAHEAFNLDVTDYLLKPFSLERFIVAVDKVKARLEIKPAVTDPDDFTFLKSDGKIFKVIYSDILYAEACGNYTKVYTTQNKLMPAVTFTQFVEGLSSRNFIRIHRSYVINKTHISHLEGNRVFIQDTELPVGNNFKADFLKSIGML